MTPTTTMIQSLLWPMQSMVNFFSPPVVAPVLHVKAIAPRFSSQAVPSVSNVVRKTTLSPVSVSVPSITVESSTHCGVRTTRTSDGRLLMSGRMRDVCAELDRLCA